MNLSFPALVALSLGFSQAAAPTPAAEDLVGHWECSAKNARGETYMTSSYDFLVSGIAIMKQNEMVPTDIGPVSVSFTAQFHFAMLRDLLDAYDAKVSGLTVIHNGRRLAPETLGLNETLIAQSIQTSDMRVKLNEPDRLNFYSPDRSEPETCLKS